MHPATSRLVVFLTTSCAVGFLYLSYGLTVDTDVGSFRTQLFKLQAWKNMMLSERQLKVREEFAHAKDLPAEFTRYFPSYGRGKWVFHPIAGTVNKQDDRGAYTCCAQRNKGYDPLRRKTISMPKCIGANYGGAMTVGRVAFGWGNWCACAVYNNAVKQNQSDDISGRWEWIAHDRHDKLPQWSAPDFCKLLGNRTLLLVGDSTMQQTWTSLINLMNFPNASCLKQLQYLASDFLAPTEAFTKRPRRKERYNSLDNLLRPFVNGTESLVIILGVAAHLNKWRRYEQAVEWVGTYIEGNRRHFMMREPEKVKFYFKTANPPHHQCAEHADPWLPGELDLGVNEMAKHDYWKSALEYDRYAAGKLWSNGTSIIDMSPLYLRPDAHTFDCLHYCMNTMNGTPLDLFARKMLKALKLPTATLV